MKRNIHNKTVLAFGTFDIVHPGHLYYLAECKKRGSRLVVVIARDSTVRALKGMKPVFKEDDRRKLVESLKMVDRAVLGDKVHHCRIIKKIRPDILCLGYDQNISSQRLASQLKQMNCTFRRIIRIGPRNPKKYKSTLYKRIIRTQQ